MYGSFSPVDGDIFVYKTEGTTSEMFHQYLVQFSKHKPNKFKSIIIDNAGFHSMKNYDIPENIKLIRIPPYSPELNASEKIWAYIKQFYKNRVFENLENVKSWLHEFIREKLYKESILSIRHNSFFNNTFYVHLEI